MLCPECKDKIAVLETRMLGADVYRRRYCTACDAYFITQEAFVALDTIPTATTGKPAGRPRKEPTVAAHNPFNIYHARS